MLDVLSIIVAPTVFWFLYHSYKDRFRPEPIVPLVLSYLSGFGAGYLCLKIYELGNRYGVAADPDGNRLVFLLYCVLVVGVLEEACKFAPFRLISMQSRHFDEPIDGIVYASAVALGFASYENFKYMEFLEGRELLARAIASPLMHCMFASIWGYACGRARHDGRPLLRPALIGLGVAALIHGVYDFLVLATHPFVRPATAGIVLVIWIWRMRLIRRLHEEHSAAESQTPDDV